MAKVTQEGNTYYGKDADKDSVKNVAIQGRAYVAYDSGKIYFKDDDDNEWVEWGSGS